jgi:hypothetical protein
LLDAFEVWADGMGFISLNFEQSFCPIITADMGTSRGL